MVEANFIECGSVEDANRVDLGVYRLERFSESKGVYIFVKRRGM